jgi:hypothetical protein
VAERPSDAAAQAQGVRARLEETRAVVRLQHHQIARREHRAQLARHVPQIRGDREAARARRDPERDVGRVVGERDRLDDERPERDRPAGRARPHLGVLARAIDGHTGMRVDGGAQRTRDGQRVRGVVTVIVRDEEPERGPRRHEVRAEEPHALDRTGRPDARVDENALALGLHDERVAARSAPEDEDAHGGPHFACASGPLSTWAATPRPKSRALCI